MDSRSCGKVGQPKRSKRRLGSEQVELHLRNQLRFLEASALAFDRGMEGEACRLATTIRVLCHQTGTSVPLLSQVQLLARTRFLATGFPIDDRNLMPQQGLASIEVGAGVARYRPFLVAAPISPRWESFRDWWWGRVIRDAKHHDFTRREVILTLANQDGGSHVDPELDEAYYELSRENSMGWFHLREGRSLQSMPFPSGPELATARQIAHEVYLSIAKYRPDLRPAPAARMPTSAKS